MRTPGLSIPTRTHTHVRVAFRKIERKGEHVRVEGVQQESVSHPPKRNFKVQISAKYFTLIVDHRSLTYLQAIFL